MSPRSCASSPRHVQAQVHIAKSLRSPIALRRERLVKRACSLSSFPSAHRQLSWNWCSRLSRRTRLSSSSSFSTSFPLFLSHHTWSSSTQIFTGTYASSVRQVALGAAQRGRNMNVGLDLPVFVGHGPSTRANQHACVLDGNVRVRILSPVSTIV